MTKNEVLKKGKPSGWSLIDVLLAYGAACVDPDDDIIVVWNSRWGDIPLDALKMAHTVLIDGVLVKDRHRIQDRVLS